MEISELIVPECIVANPKVSGQKQLFQEIAARAHELYGLDQRAVVDGLLERERLGSTAMGGGIAIPHARLEGIDEIKAFFVCLAKPLDFEAADGLGVDLIVALLVPEESGSDHLRALAKVSRLLRDLDLCDKLRAGGDKKALYALLTEQATSQAA
ncbi:PTS sugar transporter subunit IIA [Rhodobacteraceae bacterium NNCM2]|nr:PTS sugar transporter subunit IIA [Coraliihabitans acroporae]